jgi:hypothetical protein
MRDTPGEQDPNAITNAFRPGNRQAKGRPALQLGWRSGSEEQAHQGGHPAAAGELVQGEVLEHGGLQDWSKLTVEEISTS